MPKTTSEDYLPFGYLLESDEEWLAKTAKSLPKNAVVLEIGTCLGRSTQILALNSLPSVKLYTIDLIDVDGICNKLKAMDPEKITGDDLHFYEIYKDSDIAPKNYFPERMSPKITKIVGDSKTVKWNKPVDMLFIDGDHTTEYVINDIERFSPFVKSGGLVSGHDFMVMEHVINQHVRDNEKFRDFGYEPSRNLWYAIKK